MTSLYTAPPTDLSTEVTLAGNNAMIGNNTFAGTSVFNGAVTIGAGGITVPTAALPESAVNGLTADLALKAPLASPTFTGTVNVTALTASGAVTAGDSTFHHCAIGDWAGATGLIYSGLATATKYCVLQDSGGGTYLNAATGHLITFNIENSAVGTISATTWTSNINLTLADGHNIITGTANGLKIGTGTTQKLGLWNTTPIAQPARSGQLTDNSGGTSGNNTIAAIAAGSVDSSAAGLTTTKNAIATLAARLNLVEATLSTAGGGIGVTA